MTREERLDVLTRRLLGTQLDEVIYLIGAPRYHLSPHAPQSGRAVELLQWAEANNRIMQLDEVLIRVLDGDNAEPTLQIPGSSPRVVAEGSYKALCRTYVATAHQLQSCALGREDNVNLMAFRQALERAKTDAKKYLADAQGDDALMATWYAASAHYIEGSIYQERNSQREIKSQSRISSHADTRTAIGCYRAALALLGHPPIDSELAATVYFDLALETSSLDREAETLRHAFEYYEQVIALMPESDLAGAARVQMENIAGVLRR